MACTNRVGSSSNQRKFWKTPADSFWAMIRQFWKTGLTFNEKLQKRGLPLPSMVRQSVCQHPTLVELCSLLTQKLLKKFVCNICELHFFLMTRFCLLWLFVNYVSVLLSMRLVQESQCKKLSINLNFGLIDNQLLQFNLIANQKRETFLVEIWL